VNEQFRTIAGPQQNAGMNAASGMGGYQGGRQRYDIRLSIYLSFISS
jgi:hypothetical protein